MQDEKGLDENYFFVNEVSFGNVAKVMGLIHVFENGEKCNCLFMSVFFVFAKMSNENELVVNKVGFKNFVEVMGFKIFMRIVKSAMVCGCLCFFGVCHCCIKAV